MSKEISKGNQALLKGNALFKEGKYEDAAESYVKAVKCYEEATVANETPEKLNVAAAKNNLSVTYNKLGIDQLNKEYTDTAINYFKNAVEAKSDSFEANYNLGFAYKKAGTYNDAIDSFKKAKGIKQDDFSTLYNLAECQKAVESYDQAIETFKQSLSVTTDASNLLTVHSKIIETAILSNNVPALNSAAQAAFEYATTDEKYHATNKVQLNYIMVHYGKLCLSDNTNAAAKLNDIANLYCKINPETTLYTALIDFIYSDYHADQTSSLVEKIVKAEHKLGRLVKNDKEFGVFEAVKNAATLFAGQSNDAKCQELLNKIVLIDESQGAVTNLGNTLEAFVNY